MSEYHYDEVTALSDGSLEVQFDLGEKGKKTVIIDVSEGTPLRYGLESSAFITPEVGTIARQVGYFRPTSSWNIGKKQVFKDHKNFKQPELTGKQID